MSERTAELEAALEQLIGVAPYDCRGGHGSIVTIEFGTPIPRQTPIHNPHLSEAQQTTVGSYQLFVECAWRLDSEDAVLAGGYDDEVGRTIAVAGLAPLLGRPVVAVTLRRPALDLRIAFDGGLVLWLFCDHTDPSQDSNYSYGTPELLYAVGARGTLEISAREP